MLSTHPPTVCGLATFNAALRLGLEHHGATVEIVRVLDAGADPTTDPTLIAGSRPSLRAAAATLSQHDVAIVQHEYGIYGGPDGEDILALMERLTVPTIVVLHTVPADPTRRQAEILVDLCRLADSVVVMTTAARERLTSKYTSVDIDKVATIAHGAWLASTLERTTTLYANPGAQLLTWGLLGPGKGIERVVSAVIKLAQNGHPVRYTVAGVTHPKVRAREGDRYRNTLIDHARRGGVASLVTFDDTYRPVRQLTRYVASASVVVLPYDNQDQITSGVLVDSIAAGRPVIATAFPHAEELLSGGAGIIVPHDDPVAMTDAIRAVTSDHDLLRSLTRNARALAPSLSWESVADQYLSECAALKVVDQSSTL